MQPYVARERACKPAIVAYEQQRCAFVGAFSQQQIQEACLALGIERRRNIADEPRDRIAAQAVTVTAVCDILNADDSTIQPTPEVASGPTRSYMQGLLTVEDRMVGVLRSDQLVPALEFEPV